jgi:hypothetical protein
VKKTWATKDLFWPQELLPTEVPNARVLLYGYPTKRPLNIVPQQGAELLRCIEEERRRSKVISTAQTDGNTADRRRFGVGQ